MFAMELLGEGKNERGREVRKVASDYKRQPSPEVHNEAGRMAEEVGRVNGCRSEGLGRGVGRGWAEGGEGGWRVVAVRRKKAGMILAKCFTSRE